MSASNQTLPADLLKRVSRSFYLTLRFLPGAVRPQIGLAYLLARMTDTIADTDLVPIERRLELLESLRGRIAGTNSSPLAFGDLAAQQGLPAEKVLLERAEVILRDLETCPENDRVLIRGVLNTITSGQSLDLRRFGRAGPNQVVALKNDLELSDYTYRVAGCVGEFWTKICRARLFPDDPVDENRLIQDGVQFGQGLQLVNILRDLQGDLRHGRCYLPEDRLRAINLHPKNLLEPGIEEQLRPLYDHYLKQAEAHLEAGWRYTLALPRHIRRVRLACAWPILIGLETLQLLGQNPVLQPGLRIKVSRARLRRILLRSIAWYPFRSRWERLGPPKSWPSRSKPRMNTN
jgi:farnesyl-diphosphate farnesyltransferase